LASRKSHEVLAAAEDEEQVTLKGEQSSQTSRVRNQPSCGEELAPSSSIRRPKWFEKTLKDVQGEQASKEVSKLHGTKE
jgi:hypothetical protein